MRIDTIDDWRKLAEKTLPALCDYASAFSVEWDHHLAQKLFEDQSNRRLASMLDKLWADLPDHPAIRVAPFFDLCDLCSERWVLDA